MLSEASLFKLESCDLRLIKLVMAVATVFPIQVVYAHRDKAAQDEAFASGKSQVAWPNSKHNSQPSMAVDIAPLQFDAGKTSIDWNDAKRFCYLAGFVMREAQRLGVKIRWGGDWDQDTELKDNGFNDLPHFELVEEENATA